MKEKYYDLLDNNSLKDDIFSIVEYAKYIEMLFYTRNYEELAKIDFEGHDIFFHGLDVSNIDFSKLHNVSFNPQKVKGKNLEGCTLTGVDFAGKSFDGVDVVGADFTGSKHVDLDPQKVKDKSLYCTKLSNIDFDGKIFDGVNLYNTQFNCARNVIIDLSTTKINEYTSFGTSMACCDISRINN